MASRIAALLLAIVIGCQAAVPSFNSSSILQSARASLIENICSNDLPQILNHLFWFSTQYSSDFDDLKTLLSALKHVRSQQSQHTDYLPRRKSYKQALSAFLKSTKGNISIEGMTLRPYKKLGVGLVATRDIHTYEVLGNISVNHAMSTLLSADDLSCLGNIQHDSAAYPSLWRLVNLTAIILKHALGKTNFRTYINTLPKRYIHPVFFDVHDFNIIRGSVAFDPAVATIQEMSAMYSAMWFSLKQRPKCQKRLGLPIKKFTLRAFQWAYAVALTRNYDGSFVDGQINKVIIPFWDMANHKPEADCDTWNQPETGKDTSSPLGTYVTYALKPIKKGQQIHFHYQKNLDAMPAFTTWGFVEMNQITVPLPMSLLSRISHKQLQNMPTYGSVTLKAPHTKRILDDATLSALVDIATGKTNAELTPSSVRQGWSFLMSILVTQSNRYRPRSEYLALRNRNLSANAKLALRFIVAEQRMVNGLLEYAADAMGDPMAKIRRMK